MVFPCRLQPETEGLSLNSVTNDPPAAAATAGAPRIRLRKGKREFGPTIRTVTIEMTADGTGETAYLQTGDRFTLPILTNAVFNGITVDQTGTYQGIACKVVSKFPE